MTPVPGLPPTSPDPRLQAFEALAADVLWDAPPVILLGREPMRAMVYTAKSRLAHWCHQEVLSNQSLVGANT
jgi:hypothetical protein